MEPKLINRYRFDEDTLRRAYRRILRPITLFELFMALALLGFAVFFTVRYASVFSQNIPALLVVALSFALAGFEAWRALNAPAKAAREAIGKITKAEGVSSYDVTVRFEEEQIVTESSISPEPKQLPYESLLGMLCDKNLILLRTRSSSIYALDPGRFEHGTEADFWKLMNQKCPGAVPKKHWTSSGT